MKLKHNKG